MENKNENGKSIYQSIYDFGYNKALNELKDTTKKSFFKDNWKNILLIIFSLIIIVLIMSTTCTSRKLGIVENNFRAASDSLHTYEMKNGELMYEKQGYILKINELEDNIGIAKKEAKEIEKKLKSALATISKLKAEVRVDTVKMTDSVYVTPDGIYHNKFTYNDKWMALNGDMELLLNPFRTKTTINSLIMDVPLKVGTTEDNEWFAISENPYVSITSIEGANLEKAKPKRWSIGIQVGLGFVGGVGLVGTQFNNITTANTGAGWFVGAGGYLGFGITYKITDF